MRILALLLLLLAPGLAPAQEFATLRPLAVVEGPTLRLGDLFDGLGARAAQPVGAAPAPGRRLVLEVPQLLALARTHGLAWRPFTAHERIVIERPGRPVPREEIEATLRADLLPLGLDPEAELDLGRLVPPMVPPAAEIRLATEAANFDPASGRFAATLLVLAEGMPGQRLRLSGRARPTRPVVVATRRLALGEIVGPDDVRLTRMWTERVRPGAAQRLDQVVGQQLRRPMASGAIFMTTDLGSPAMVEKNSLVTMLLEAPGLSLTAQGRALETAPRGGIVPVMNLASRNITEGQVIGPGRVRVALGTLPIAR